MFGRGKKTGEVGINKEADRQIILWIANMVCTNIKSKNFLNFGGQKLQNSTPINNYNMNDAYAIWKNVELKTICAKFITAYKKKIFSKSQKLVLDYFNALKAILDSEATPTSDQLGGFLTACEKIADNKITRSRALLNLSKGNDSKLRTAMNQQLKNLEHIIKQKQ